MLNNTFESFVALRYLRSKRKEVFISIITVISLLGVALSVMVLNIVLSVMTGFEEELQSKLIDANAHITIKKNAGSIEQSEELIEIVSKIPGIRSAYPYTYSQAMLKLDRVAGIPVNTPGLKFDSSARGLLIRGLDNSKSPRNKLLKSVNNESVLDTLFSKAPLEVEKQDGTMQTVNLPTILIGKELQRKLGVYQGDTVVLLSPELGSSPLGIVPKHRRFIISGFYSSGLVEYESGLAYLGLKEAQEFFGFGSQVTGVEIEVEDRNKTTEIMNLISSALTDFPESLFMSDWTEQNKPLWDAIKLEKRVYFIVLLLLILIASFSIVSTLVMVVMEKGRDIAIFKSMGASDRQILKIFLIQGSIVGFSGVLLGTFLGVVGCVGLQTFGFPIDVRVFSIDTVPVNMKFINFLTVALVGFFITSLAGIYPARRASRLNPAEALRFE